MQLLENIDPNPDNFVCAGIIHTRNLQIGVLLRLEPNKQAEVSSDRGGFLVLRDSVLSLPFTLLFPDVSPDHEKQ